MAQFIHKRILHSANCFALNHRSPFSGLNLFSSASTNAPKPSSKNPNQNPFAVLYLKNTLGFPHASALTASKVLYFKSSAIPNSIIALFKSLGLNDAQISFIVRKNPMLLQFRKDNLLPKIEFLRSLGFCGSHFPKILASALGVNLKTQLIPCFSFLESFFSTNEDLLNCIKMFPNILASNFKKVLAVNIEILRQVGLPERNITYMLKRNPRAMLVQPSTFQEAVDRAAKIGFNPLSTNFVKGIWAMRISRLSWKEKMEAYKRWGLSEDEVLATFRTYPWFMLTSPDKITRVLEFFVNEMGCGASVVMKMPPVVSLSLEKTIVPRCAVFRVLVSKGLLKKNASLATLLMCSEKKFLNKYVKIYEEEAPELLEVYREKLDLSKQVDC